MASMKPTGPAAIVWDTPFRALWMCAGPARVCTAPWATKMIPATKAIGKRM